MPEDVYHNDPTPLSAEGFKEYTSLSSTVALSMIEETEIEARMKIQRFNQSSVKPYSDAMNVGTIVHNKILQGKVAFEVVPFKDFRTSDAKAAKAEVIERGLIPLAQNEKTEEFISSVNKMEQRLHEQLAEHMEFPNLMEKGLGEQSGFYFDEALGIWKRARFDWLDNKYTDFIWDYKTTALDSEIWINRELWKTKYIQCPHYMDVLNGIRGGNHSFGFVLQRTSEPFLVEIVIIDAGYMDYVRKRYDVAQRRFANCLKTGKWRGNPPYAKHAYPPPWVITRWEEEEVTHESVKANDEDIRNLSAG